MPWPAIGPDVTGGNVTAGSGAAANLGGHVYKNPAMSCFLEHDERPGRWQWERLEL